MDNLVVNFLFFFFFLLDYTVQSVVSQSFTSSAKNVTESVSTQSVSEATIYLKEFKSVQAEGVQVFESISESSTVTAACPMKTEEHFEETITQTLKEQVSEIETEVQETSDEAPKILLKIHDMTVKVGEVAQFICAVQEDNLQVTWKHENQTIEDTTRVKISKNGNVMLLTIENAQLTDQGTYSCTVSNAFGEKTTTAVLTVEGGYFNIAVSI